MNSIFIQKMNTKKNKSTENVKNSIQKQQNITERK